MKSFSNHTQEILRTKGISDYNSGEQRSHLPGPPPRPCAPQTPARTSIRAAAVAAWTAPAARRPRHWSRSSSDDNYGEIGMEFLLHQNVLRGDQRSGSSLGADARLVHEGFGTMGDGDDGGNGRKRKAFALPPSAPMRSFFSLRYEASWERAKAQPTQNTRVKWVGASGVVSEVVTIQTYVLDTSDRFY
ncbi:hypothetical protein BHM03_00014278 [Ensete ventricosum]|nr:hypothetical protein BHM03_00014278 [Ensete ventricosum]